MAQTTFCAFFTAALTGGILCPGLTSIVFDMKIPIDTSQYLDETFFVMFFGIVVAIVHPIWTQLIFKTALNSLYTYYKKQGENSDDR